MGALQLAPVLMDEQASPMKKQAQLAVQPVHGSAVPLQPCRTAGYGCRCHAGQCRREYLGGFVTDLYQKWTATDKERKNKKSMRKPRCASNSARG